MNSGGRRGFSLGTRSKSSNTPIGPAPRKNVGYRGEVRKVDLTFLRAGITTQQDVRTQLGWSDIGLNRSSVSWGRWRSSSALDLNRWGDQRILQEPHMHRYGCQPVRSAADAAVPAAGRGREGVGLRHGDPGPRTLPGPSAAKATSCCVLTPLGQAESPHCAYSSYGLPEPTSGVREGGTTGSRLPAQLTALASLKALNEQRTPIVHPSGPGATMRTDPVWKLCS